MLPVFCFGEKPMTEFDELGSELDQESWDWLDDNHPTIAAKIAMYVQRGATPDEIRKYVRKRVGTHREEFALRCLIAARHLESSKKP
jgi:hypothetical protein